MSLKMSEMLDAEKQAFAEESGEHLRTAVRDIDDLISLAQRQKVLLKQAAELLRSVETYSSVGQQLGWSWLEQRDQWLRDAER
jgi:hypothetical protein